MQLTGSSPLFMILGFLLGLGVVYFLVRIKKITVNRLDDRTLVLKLPFLGCVEANGPTKYQGLFVRNVSETLNKVKLFQGLMDFDLMLRYAQDYNINYIGVEGDNPDGSWSKGRLAYSTLSKGHNGGYDIFLNPDLDRDVVCSRLKEELGLDIKPEELHTFLFLHEIGHTRKAGNDCYISARLNHSLSGGRRSVRRRRELKLLHSKVERFADDFAIKELLKWRGSQLLDSGYPL
ncbi:MAG TPA: hypothetical protein EYP21_06315 [Syntrophaceae bacterium]|nr:hypothetical protein [Syntrophaceae bacterium]